MLLGHEKINFLYLPTPLERLNNLSQDLGINLYIKRDDLTPLAMGGNKLRKLEYLLADAKKQGATMLLTVGGAQTNHGRLTCAVARKYGLKAAIVCIDDYKHLAQIFKKSGIDEIVVMIAKKICELEPDAHVYRCGADEFIVIFPAAEKGASFARVDNIRRTVAASEFLLSGRKKALKLTVSCSVADKKRSDADIFEVFMRARKILQKTYKFTQNITSQA